MSSLQKPRRAHEYNSLSVQYKEILMDASRYAINVLCGKLNRLDTYAKRFLRCVSRPFKNCTVVLVQWAKSFAIGGGDKKPVGNCFLSWIQYLIPIHSWNRSAILDFYSIPLCYSYPSTCFSPRQQSKTQSSIISVAIIPWACAQRRMDIDGFDEAFLPIGIEIRGNRNVPKCLPTQTKKNACLITIYPVVFISRQAHRCVYSKDRFLANSR